MPLIVFEGIDGSGKSTQARRLLARLGREGIAHATCRDPGGTRIGEAVRELLLDPENRIAPSAELFGYLLARAQLVDEVLRPHLEAGEVVVLDRFYHSTIVYQAFGLGLPRELVESAIELGVDGVHPDLTCYCRCPPEVAARRRSGRGEDRIEGRGLEYLRRVHDGYERLAEEGRLRVFDGTAEPDVLEADIWDAVRPLVPEDGRLKAEG